MAQERLEEIRSARLLKRQAWLEKNLPPYPAEIRRSHTLTQVHQEFEILVVENRPITVAGRIMSIRRHGALVFMDLLDASGQLQLQITKSKVPADIFEQVDLLDSGDWIEASGEAIVTQRGVKSLSVLEWHIISKSIRALPDRWYGLKDHEARWRRREVDLLLNPKTRELAMKRGQIIHWLRQYFLAQGYLEVETPILQPLPGGTAARPFTTQHHALDTTLYLRIATELYLKRLLVGGYEKVFEIGRYFRNEGIDRQHNPEFTMLEAQWTYADYEDYMDFTETMLEKLVTHFCQSPRLDWQGVPLSFAKPFKRVRFVDLVSEKLGFNILENKDPEAYMRIFEREGLDMPNIRTYTKLIDELYKELIRPTIIQPTLIFDYPVEMIPLAKANLTDSRVAEMFQLVIHGAELVKAYTELNDPVVQRQMFEKQQLDREKGDDEAHSLDEAYLEAMEYGMPPNAGWGMGVDRLVMLLTDTPNIRETILFPLLKPLP